MLIRKINNCNEIIAGDSTRLRELLHPNRDYPFDGHYSLAHAVVATGQKSRRHRLRSNEVYYIISGQGRMHINNETASVEPGDAINIPAGSVQWIENLSQDDLVFLCIVDPAWKIENEEIL
ncbi:MAG: cupin domain-containing protein [Candidatus Zixiibacteriota bacterium]|nr:MAG: cupin domain-containing protein [candidate division Zixibacteria bacterium]